jgi:hypothetical protein
MWLIDAEGHSLHPAKTPLPETKETKKLLVQMNLLNGHVDFLSKNIALSLPWFYENKNTSKLKFHFLKLQAHRYKDPQKIALLLANPWFLHQAGGLSALLEENIANLTEDLLPLCPPHLFSHRNFPIALIPKLGSIPKPGPEEEEYEEVVLEPALERPNKPIDPPKMETSEPVKKPGSANPIIGLLKAFMYGTGS